MHVNIWQKSSKYQQLSIIILGMLLGSAEYARADTLNAHFVMNTMDADNRYPFVAGVVRGLAYARFLRDRPNEDGMLCVLDWLNNDVETSWEKVRFFFERHPDKPPAVLLHVLIKKDCGE